jgi:hypothetical protein
MRSSWSNDVLQLPDAVLFDDEGDEEVAVESEKLFFCA